MAGQRVDVIDRYGGLYATVEAALADTGHPLRRIEPAALGTNGDAAGTTGLSIISLCLPPDDLTLARKHAGRIRNPIIAVSGCEPMTAAASVLLPNADRILSLPLDDAVLRELALVLLDRHATATPVAVHGMVGTSDAFQRLVAAVEKVAETDSTVLLEGETGTGKEVAARAIHKISERKDGPFVAVDCGALSETLMESELFGHVRGAFTGASASRKGLFESANGGTLFLDQVDDVSPAVQMKLLRTIQERRIRRVGSVKEVPINVRLVAASRKDLGAEVEAGRFREDLYYRLNVFRIVVPLLRERAEDIDPLIDYALQRYGGDGERCSPLAREILRGYHWPGNIRQLLAVVESATIRAENGRLDANHLPLDLIEDWRSRTRTTREDRSESDTLQMVLAETDGNRTQAAELMGISRTTLWRRIKELNVEL